MIIIILTLSVVLLFALIGYRYDKNKNEFVQGGLVQFISQPSGATVHVDSTQLGAKTRSKVTLFPGTYTVKMSLTGYRDWQKNTTVKSNIVVWLDSARLVPNSPQTTTVAEVPTITSTAVLPENPNFAYMTDATQPVISLLAPDDQTPKATALTIPATAFAAGEHHNFSLVKWRDKRYLLVKHTLNTGTEWLIVDTTNSANTHAVTDISPTVKVKKVFFDPRDEGKVFAWYDDGSVRNITLNDGTISDPLLEHVSDLYVNGDGTLFAAKITDPGQVNTVYLSYGAKTPTILGTYPTTLPVHIAGGEYYSDFYITTTVGATMKVHNYTDLPTSGSSQPLANILIYQTELPAAPSSLTLHRGARYVSAEFGTGLATYDMETKVFTTVPFVGVTQPLSDSVDWLDTNHFYTTTDGKLRQYEFDGTNQTDIVSVAPGTNAMYSASDKYLLTIAKSKNGYQIQRTLMVLP